MGEGAFSFEEFVETALKTPGNGSNFLGWSIFGAAAWSIWLMPNDYLFNDKITSSLLNNMYKMISLLSQWKCMLPTRRRDRWEKMLEALKINVGSLQLFVRARSGVV